MSPPALRPVQTAYARVRAVLVPEEMERAEKMLNAQWPKRCGCGRAWWSDVTRDTPAHAYPFGRAQWWSLVPRYQSTDEAGVLEARDCVCGSTISIYLAILDPDVAAEEP